MGAQRGNFTCRVSSALASRPRTFFHIRDRCEKPFQKPLSAAMKLLNPVKEELGDHREDLECQRSAPQSAAERRRTRQSAPPPTAPPSDAPRMRQRRDDDDILGTLMTCLGTGKIKGLLHLRQCVIENLDHERNLADVVRDVPLQPAPASQQTQAEVLAGRRRALPQTAGRAPAGEWGSSRSSPCSSARSPTPGPGNLRSPWGGMVLCLGQNHCDAQTFVTKELSEPSLPPSSGVPSRCQHSSCRQPKAVSKVTQTRALLREMACCWLIH